ncbi:hypothetical protein GOBAR_DD30878 [Gossypium barbadense]|nr:hypothetical protein GOBAR_DD30878 [Gossypium barbadense]
MDVFRFDDSSSAENPLLNHIDKGVDMRARRGLVISDSGGKPWKDKEPLSSDINDMNGTAADLESHFERDMF